MRKPDINKLFKSILSALLLYSASVCALQPPPMSYPFPLDNYDQNISHWIPKNDSFDKALMDSTVQEAQMNNFKNRLLLPWDDQYIAQLLTKMASIQADELANLNLYDNKTKSAGAKGRPSCNYTNNDNAPYPDSWIQNLNDQVNLSQFAGKNSIQGKGIALDNLNMRALPTDDHFFNDCSIPGEGDSFDYLQFTALWAGTPVYIIGESLDHRWYLVRSPDVRGWVKSAGIKRVSDKFVSQWLEAANREGGLVAVNSAINTNSLPISDEATGTKRFLGFIGAVFPIDPQSKTDENGYHVMIPIAESELPVKAYLSKKDASVIPLAPTLTNFSQMTNHLIGRTYGWGSINIDNPKNFLNDCSQELKSFFTPFGIWLPRNSLSQVTPSMMIGSIDHTYPSDAEERIKKLTQEEQHPFTTIVYIANANNTAKHIFMYVGQYQDPVSHVPVALTYQNLWGLRPMPGTNPVDGTPLPDGRYVIGKSVLFPLLSHYPEKYPNTNRELVSFASKPLFVVAHLDRLPATPVQPSVDFWSYMGMKYFVNRWNPAEERIAAFVDSAEH